MNFELLCEMVGDAHKDCHDLSILYNHDPVLRNWYIEQGKINVYFKYRNLGITYAKFLELVDVKDCICNKKFEPKIVKPKLITLDIEGVQPILDYEPMIFTIKHVY